MRYINFEISGTRVRPKILTYCSTRFPSFQIYGNDSLSAFSITNATSEQHIFILFNHENNENKAIINLGFTDYNYNFLIEKALDKLFLNAEYKKFEEWAIKWELIITNKQVGVRPQYTSIEGN